MSLPLFVTGRATGESVNKIIVALVALFALGTAQAQYQSRDTSQPQSASSIQLIEQGYYTNSSGQQVHGPAHTVNNLIPAGATAQCRDGSYSFSQHHRGTCSHHGGVEKWL